MVRECFHLHLSWCKLSWWLFSFLNLPIIICILQFSTLLFSILFFVCIFLYVIFSLFCTFFLLFVVYLTPSSPSFIILFEKYIVIFLIIFIGTYIEIRDWLEIKIRNAEVCFSYFFVNYIAFPIFVFVSVFWDFRLTFDVIRYLFILLSSNWLWVFLVHVVLEVQLGCKDFFRFVFLWCYILLNLCLSGIVCTR